MGKAKQLLKKIPIGEWQRCGRVLEGERERKKKREMWKMTEDGRGLERGGNIYLRRERGGCEWYGRGLERDEEKIK